MHHWSLGLVAIAGLALVACNRDPDGGTGPDEPPTTVEDSLDRLSVERKIAPRLGPDGNPLPEDHAPLGVRADLQRFAEIGAFGFRLTDQPADDAYSLLRLDPGAGPSLAPVRLGGSGQADAPWASGIRGATTADIDGDGLDEVVVVTWEAPFVQARIIEDADSGLAVSEPRVVADVEPVGITVEAIDVDGDGDDDLAIGLVTDAAAQVRFIETDGGSLTPTGVVVDLAPGLGDADLSMRLAAGRVDGDLGEELGVVLNELGSSEARASFTLLDDASANYAELLGGPVRNPMGDEIYTARAADVALGDIDGDGIDEIVLGGLTNVSFGTSEKEWGVLAYALDDAFTGFDGLPERYLDQRFQGLSESGQSLRLQTVFIDTLDIDGDNVDEIHVLQTVYDDFAQQAPWTVIGEIDTEELIWEFGNADFTTTTAAMAIGDVTLDGRDDIVFRSFASSSMQIWGIDATEPGVVQALAEVPSDDLDEPLIVLPDLNGDSIQVTYDGGSYQLVFTEPVVIAALAAPPCNPDWGQDVGACTTGFGEATSNSIAEEDSYTVTAGVTVGFSQSFSVLGVEVGGLEVLQSIQTSVGRTLGETYTLTKRVVHTTGPLEDSVLFTTIPMDQYTYVITSHPNPELVGGEVVVSTPRTPIEALVTRELYNASILEPELAIDDRVFSHTEGDPRSYPTVADRDALLGRFDGLSSPEVDVGQGGGNSLVEISVFEEQTAGSSYGVEYSVDLKATAGSVVVGANVGWSAGSTITYASGQESLYQGRVANLDEPNFVENGYAYGMFTYVYETAGREFEVIDYWVR